MAPPSIDAGCPLPEPAPHFSGKRRWDDDNNRMLQLMLGQFQRSGETLDLLGASASPQPFESPQLDLDVPHRPRCEKCLDLKTGSIYYTDRSTGTITSWHSRKHTVAYLNSPPSPSSCGLSRELSSTTHSNHAYLKMQKRVDDCRDEALEMPAIGGDGGLELGLSLSVDLNSHPEDQLHEASPSPAIEYDADLLSERSWIQKSRSTACSPSSPSQSTISFKKVEASGKQMERHLGKVSEVESIKWEATSMIVGCAKCLMFVMLSRTDPKCPKCGTCAPLDFLQPGTKKSKFGFAT